MNNNLEFCIFFFLFYILGRGLAIITLRDSSPDKIELYQTKIYIFYPVFAVFFISSSIFLVNFFLPLSKFKNFLLIVALLIMILGLKKFKFPMNKLNSILYFIIFPAVLSFSSYAIKFHYDAEAYHLVTQSWINESKIVFGLTKFFVWLGHSSLYEYIQSFLSFQNNFIYQHYLNLIFVLFFVSFLYFHLVINKDTKYFYPSLFILIFGILDNFGFNGGSNGFIEVQMVGKPDIAVGVIFLIVSLFLINGIYYGNNSATETKFILLLITFAIQIRIFSILLLILLIPYLVKNKIVIKNLLISKFFIFIFIYNLVWVVKNIIISSCIFFPIKFTCFNNLKWSIPEIILAVDNYYEDWVYSYKFNKPLIPHLYELLNAGHNYIQIPNYIFSVIFLVIVKKIFFKKINHTFYLIWFINLIYVIIALYTSFIPRYWYGLLLLIIASIALNIEIKNKYKIFLKNYFLVFTFIILIIGFPRGYSYKYFSQNIEYYRLNIDYQEYEVEKNDYGYGVISKKNKCYDITYCTTFQFSNNFSVNLKKYFLNYQIFD